MQQATLVTHGELIAGCDVSISLIDSNELERLSKWPIVQKKYGGRTVVTTLPFPFQFAMVEFNNTVIKSGKNVRIKLS